MNEDPDQTTSAIDAIPPTTRPRRFLVWYSRVLIALGSLIIVGSLVLLGIDFYNLARRDSFGVDNMLLVLVIVIAHFGIVVCFFIPQFFSVFRRSLRAAIWTLWIFRIAAFLALGAAVSFPIFGLLFSGGWRRIEELVIGVFFAVVFGLFSLNVRQHRTWIGLLRAAQLTNLESPDSVDPTKYEPVLRIPLFWKRLILVSAAALVAISIIPGYHICNYHFTFPTPTTNYLADFNKEVMAIPESERAWTHYKKLFGKDLTAENRKHLSQAAQGKLLIEVRKATEYEHLGFLLGDGSTDSTVSADAIERAKDFFHLIVSIDATPAFELPQHALYLDWEAAVSAGNGNWELATIDIIAMLNIAQQLDDVPGSLFLLESYKIGRHAMERVLICMMHQSSGFSIDQLARLEERIKKYKLQKFRSDFAGNAWVFDDMLQQMFVVTESGDGYLHLPSYDDPRDSMKGWEVLVAPWVAKQKYCSLSEIKQQHSRLMQIANREFSQPAWKLGRSKLVATVMELAENEKLTVLTEIFPDLTTSYIVSEQAHETADVVLIIIAARRYAIEHGNWPTDLHDLVPSYLERIPRNRFDGKQYCSNLKDGLLTVYSFGFDGDDDRGRVRLLEDSEDESDAPGHVKPRVYRLGRKPYRAERNVIASDWQNRIQNGHVVEYDRDIVHFQELPPIPDSQTKESKDRNKDDAPGASR